MKNVNGAWTTDTGHAITTSGKLSSAKPPPISVPYGLADILSLWCPQKPSALQRERMPVKMGFMREWGSHCGWSQIEEIHRNELPRYNREACS